MDVLDQVQKTIDFIDAHISIEDEILGYRKNLRKLITQTFKVSYHSFKFKNYYC